MLDAEMAALAALYRQVDVEVAALGAGLAVGCDGCGGCCRFDAADHVLFASDLERRYLLLSTSREMRSDAAPELVSRGLRCPFQHGAICAARDGRVLGCRLHFCDARWAGAAEELSHRWHARLKMLHDDLGVPWRYSPLLPLGDG